MLTSSVFKAMLSRHFKESVVLKEQGLLEICLPEDSPSVLLILLNIIHGHIRKVPRSIDIGSLLKVATLVDKYEFHESAQLFSDIWIEGLKKHKPTSMCGDVMSWLCVSWVFKRPIEFREMTHIAERELTTKINQYIKSYTIPESIVG